MAFTHTWDATFEGDPLDSDYVAMGPYEIRAVKQATAERMGLLKLQTGSNWDTKGYTLGVARLDTTGGTVTSAAFAYVHSADFELEQSSDVLLDFRAEGFITSETESTTITYRFEVDSAAQSSFKVDLPPTVDLYYRDGRLVSMRMIVANLAASTHTVCVEASSDNYSAFLRNTHITVAPIWTD